MPEPDLQSLAPLLAPHGVLRAAINLGNPVLARRPVPSASPEGISVDLATALAERLGVDLSLIICDKAAQSVEAVRRDQADIGFFAVDPLRSEGIAFTAPYLLIEGAYLVRQDSPLLSNDQVDDARCRVVVSQGSAYDLYLSRSLAHANLGRAPQPTDVLPWFLAQSFDVAAGIRPQLEDMARQHPGLRVLPGRFMVIEQAMGLPSSRASAARSGLAGFLAGAMSRGLIETSMRRHQVTGAVLAPTPQP
jgi:polar amino acid transport system substrate-binding protein